MKRQRGITLSGMMMVLVVLIPVALLGMVVTPSVLEFYKIKKAVKAVGQDSSLKSGSVADVRKAFGKYQEIDFFKKVNPEDLDITKDENNGNIVVGFAYQDKIPLFANVSLVIDYEASSNK